MYRLRENISQLVGSKKCANNHLETLTTFQGKIAALVFLLVCEIDSLRLTISLSICFWNYGLWRSISPVWWLKGAALVSLAAASFMRPFSDDTGPGKALRLENI